MTLIVRLHPVRALRVADLDLSANDMADWPGNDMRAGAGIARTPGSPTIRTDPDPRYGTPNDNGAVVAHGPVSSPVGAAGGRPQRAAATHLSTVAPLAAM